MTATLENSWGEYIKAVNAYNVKMEKKLDKEYEKRLIELRQRPRWKQLLFSNAEMWLEMEFAVRISRAWKEATVEDCLTWLANKKSF